MTYNPRQTFEAGRGSIYSSYKPPSKSKPKPSRNSMTFEPGRGSIYDTYKPPKKSKPKPPNRNTGGYDPVGGGSIDDPGYKGPGLGSPPNTGNDKDDSSSQDTFIDTLMKKVKSSFNFAGGTSQNDEPTDPDPVSVYTADVFEIPTIQVGYENPNPMRSGEEIATDIARMFDRSKDKGYYQYSTEAGSRYDEVPAASANKNLEVNKTKSAVERFLKDVIAPDSKEYKIKKNDTLSAIALREGVTVEDLVKVNGIKDKDRIYTDETLIIPESKDMQKVKDFVDSIDPDAQFYQSGVSMEDREFEPELGYDEIALPSEATVDKKIKGLGARPEVTVTELDATGYDEVPQTITEGLGASSNAKTIRNLYNESGTTQLKSAQTLLKQKGYYQGQAIDGVRGTNEVSNTTKAIQTFQYNNDIPATGELDDATKLALARSNSIDAVAAQKSSDAMLANISEGEGSYGAANNGTSSLANTFRVSGSYYSDTYNKPLVEMTINEILNAQTGNTGLSTEELLTVNATTEEAQSNRELFAVGAYQIIPETMQAAISAGIVTGNEKFTPSVQDQIAIEYLAGSKRENLRDYVQGKSGVTLNQAAADMAKEWASYPVPEDTYNDEGVLIARQGESRYGSGNQAQHDLEATKEMLRNAREAYLAGIENI